MTTEEFNKSLEKKLLLILKENKPLLLGVRSVMALQSKRIWLDAKNKSGSPIGTYKGGSIYVSPKPPKKSKRSFGSFPLKGKGGKTTFKNGNKHKTGYFESYLAFKKVIGRNKRTSSVDLLLTGTLSQDWSNSEVVGKATANKINQHNYNVSLSQDSIDKVDRYGVNEVFGLSTIEKGKLLAVVRNELAKALK